MLNLSFYVTLKIIMYVSLKSFQQKKTCRVICKSFLAKMKLQFPKMSSSIKTDPVLFSISSNYPNIDETYRLLT